MVAFRFRSLTRIVAPMLLVLAIVLLASCSRKDATTTTVSVGTSAASGTATTGGTSAGGQAGSPPSTPPSVPQSRPPQPGGSSEYAKRLPGLKKAVQANPNDLKALGQLAIGYYQTRAYPQAEATYKKMLAIRDAAETHNNLGNVYRDWQKTEQAIAQYEKAIALDPALVSPYANLAALYMMRGDMERARKIAAAGVGKTSGAAKQQLQALLDSLK